MQLSQEDNMVGSACKYYMMVLVAEYNDKLGRKPGAIRVVAEKDKDFTSCCFENISDYEVKKKLFSPISNELSV